MKIENSGVGRPLLGPATTFIFPSYIFQYNRFETYPNLDTPLPFEGGSSTVYSRPMHVLFVIPALDHSGHFLLPSSCTSALEVQEEVVCCACSC